MGRVFGVRNCEKSSYKRLRKRVRFFFFFTLCSPAGMSHPDTAQYQRDFKKEICESSRGLYPSLTAD